VQSVPTPTVQNGLLSSVSCTSANECTAVGDGQNNTEPQTLAERWDGTGWSIQTTPTPNNDAFLSSVSCPSSTSCVAVGTIAGGQQTLAELWNGTSWSTVSTPNPGEGGVLSGVSCLSATDCVAVGYYDELSSDGYTVSQHALAESWNGQSWSVQTTPEPAGSSNVQLSSVSCPSAAACTAAGGDSDADGAGVTLAERWDGQQWSIQTTPNPSDGSGAFTAVSCTSPSYCAAVGSGDGSGLAESWDGQNWSIQATPSAGGGLTGVSCTSATTCEATSFDGATSAESWNGSAWSIQSTPDPDQSNENGLNGVSCIGTSNCISVGSTTAFTASALAVAEQLSSNGWALQSIPNPSFPMEADLLSVSCPSASFCAAVGSTGNGASVFSEVWRDGAWSIVPVPSPAGTVRLSLLSSVSCTSGSFCVAVGDYCADICQGNLTLAEVWNGSTWSVQPTGDADLGETNQLTSVSCTSPSACTAVGGASSDYSMRFQYATVIQRWDGTSWAMQTPPNLDGAALDDVSCSSATVCTAINGADTATWNGSTWSAQPTAWGGAMSGLSCTAASACTAVGYVPAPNGAADGDTTLAERFDGSGWSTQTTPDPGDQSDRLLGVACGSATVCTAVGYTSLAPLVEAWNGTSWTVQPAPNPGDASSGVGSQLTGVSCTPGAACVAVGSYQDTSGNDRALVEQYIGAATSLGVSLSPASVPADGQSQSTVTVTVTDAEGNPVAGDQVSFASSDSGETIGPVTDQGNGTYTATVTSSTTPGVVTITATDGSVSPSVSGQATLTQTALASSPSGSGSGGSTVVSDSGGAGSTGASGSGAAGATGVSGSSGAGSSGGSPSGVTGSSGKPTSTGGARRSDGRWAAAAIGLGRVTGITLSVPVRCVGSAGATCSVRITLSVTETIDGGQITAVAAGKTKHQITHKVVIVGATTVTLHTGQRRTASFSLNATGRALLAAHLHLTMALRFTARYKLQPGSSKT